jgi:hypothetical protein
MARNRFNKMRSAVIKAFGLGLLIALTLCSGITALAATQTADLFLLSEQSNMAVTIYYDSEKPVVSFIAPNGDTYAEADLRVETGDKSVCYYIPNAAPGRWQIVYDKLTNANLDVNWAPYANPIKITDFGFAPFGSENNTDVTFTVTSDTDGWYNYAVYAAVTDANGNVSGKRELAKSTANVNQQTTVRVWVDKLQTYDKYHFYLDVWRSEYGLEATDTAVSDGVFSVVNANAPQAVENADVTVDLTESLLTIDWNAYKVWCDEYVLAVFNTADESEPIYSNAFTADYTSTEILFPPDSEKLRIELSYIQNGATSQMLRKDVPINTGVSIGLPQIGVVSAKQANVSYQTDKTVSATVKVNDRIEQISLNGNGSFSVEIDDFDNEIEISYGIGDEQVVYLLRQTVSVDTTPPMLYLPENDVTLFVTSETFDLAGATEIDCVLTVNGEAVPLNTDGTFLKTLALAIGDNEFIVNSTDPAGNIATQLIVINRAKPGAVAGSTDAPLWERYIALIGSFAASIVLLAAVLILTRRYAKNKLVSRSYAVTAFARAVLGALTALSAGGAAFVIWRYITLKSIVESEKLFDEAKASIAGAYETIKEYGLFSGLLLYAVVAFAACAALFAVSVILARTLKRRESRKAEPDTSAEPKPESEAAPKTADDEAPREEEKRAPSDEDSVVTPEPATDSALPPDGVSETDIKTSETPPDSEKHEYVCPNCGASYGKPVKFCGKCGGTMR